MTAQALAVDLQGVSKHFGDGDEILHVFRGFELRVEQGAVVAVVGPSGVGKSSLLNLIAGLLPADQGSIKVFGKNGIVDVASLGKSAAAAFRRDNIGYVFQFFNLVPTLTVEENVRLPHSLTGQEAHWHNSLARLDKLGLKHRLHAFPEQLSGGERQRVALARALAHAPPIVLADEPTGNLDQHNTEVVASLLFGEVRDIGATMLVATHNMSVAAMADYTLDLG